MRVRATSLLGLLALFLMGLWMPRGIWADSINEKIDKERKALEQLKDQIEEKRRQADEAKSVRSSTLLWTRSP